MSQETDHDSSISHTPPTPRKKCETCNGTGNYCRNAHELLDSDICITCNGTGYAPDIEPKNRKEQ